MDDLHMAGSPPGKYAPLGGFVITKLLFVLYFIVAVLFPILAVVLELGGLVR